MATMTNWSFNLLCSLTFLPLVHALSPTPELNISPALYGAGGVGTLCEVEAPGGGYGGQEPGADAAAAALNPWRCFALYAVVNAVGAVYLTFTLPETKGRSVADIQKLFAARWVQWRRGDGAAGYHAIQ